MGKTKGIFIMLLLLLVQTLVAPINVNALSIWDTAYTEGKAVGESYGQIYGQKDYINGHRNNWQRAYQEEEKKVIEDYKLNEESTSYKFYFLRGFKEQYQTGYENGYKSVNTDKKKTQYDIGRSHGELFGSMKGEISGREDYYNEKTNNWKRQLPSDAIIEKEYTLNKDTDQYKEGFLIGYKTAFEEGYLEAYRNTNIDQNRIPKENGTSHGYEMGFELGSVLGKIDFSENKDNRWEDSLPANVDIMIQYNLMREVKEYRDGFLVGFKNGFRDSYIESFQGENISLGKDNINYQLISMLGGEIKSADEIVRLKIDPGTIYKEKYLSIQRGDFPSLYSAKSYLPVTNAYMIESENQVNTISLHQPMRLTFQYYGSNRGGIYKRVNNKWVYLYSIIKNGEISTKIDSKSFNGGTYAVMIDDDYEELRDIYSNWASDEIYTYIRREYISGYEDKTFRPGANITRAEFLTLLSRVSDWNNNVGHDEIKKFNDYNLFGVYKDVIAKATSIGLVNGYEDGTFKPNKFINYNEIEWIIQRLPNNHDFKWSEIEDKMMYEKYTRSKSLFSKENNITRAEVVYMLHYLENEKRI